MKRHDWLRRKSIIGLLALIVVLAGPPCLADSDLFMRDTATDGGAEPYTGPGPVYLSPDIWVRNSPDPNFDPQPFSSPGWTPAAHQNPEYRNTKTSSPNYVYVRVHNGGDEPSSGNERLRLYQAKASTALAWPSNWVDNVAPFCGADRLLGIEVTKPRRNAKSVSAAERTAYREAVVKIGSDPAYQYSDSVQYFRKQNSVHQSPNPEHGNPAFLPWHREMMNRYEALLRETDPLVTLLYWDFTQNPLSGTNLFTTSFMGSGSGTVADPLIPLRPPTLTRNVGGTATDAFGNVVCSAALFQSDAVFNAMGSYPSVSGAIEQVPNHDCAHGFIGGYGSTAGQISSLSTAAQDPVFFMLHANVDRQWANWQRKAAEPGLLDPVSVYGSDSSHTRINASMNPWNGATGLAPWNGVGAATSKTSKDRSIVFPPIYDTAPLRIPQLQPGQSVVIEIPWYPPNVNDYDCAGQAGHFCLLARIETSDTAPFGMSTAEGVDIGTNTRNNNNIAWKNVTIVDDVADSPLLLMISGTIIRNIFERDAMFEIALIDRTEKRRFVLPEFARVTLALPEEILERIRSNRGQIQDLRFVNDKRTQRPQLQVVGKHPRFLVPMKPGETFTAELVVDLMQEEIPRALLAEPYYYDIEQRLHMQEETSPRPEERRDDAVGGVRFALDFERVMKERARKEDTVKPGGLRFELRAPSRQVLIDRMQVQAPKSLQQWARSADHVSVGEPVEVVVQQKAEARLRSLSLEIDGREVARAERSNELRQTVNLDKPGVYTLSSRAITENGEVMEARTRVLVSDNIPPNALILSPESGTRFERGEPIQVTAVASPAYQREVAEVSLYVKEGDLIETGQNLVASRNFEPVETLRGPGPHEFSFTPERPGMYMLQVGAVDDEGNVGVSGHAMIMVVD